jgi:hypothetical protein
MQIGESHSNRSVRNKANADRSFSGVVTLREESAVGWVSSADDNANPWPAVTADSVSQWLLQTAAVLYSYTEDACKDVC